MTEYTQNRKCIAELGCLNEIGAVAKAFGSSALVVSYKSMQAAVEKIQGLLEAAGVRAIAFTDILPEPTIACMEAGHRAIQEHACEMVVAIGGGSVIDSAKAIAMLATNPESLEAYQLGKASIDRQPLPILAIPTTAGTGSEATKTCVISNERLGVKKSINHYSLVPQVALLDGSLLQTLPPRILASTGMDALGHAIESFTSRTATPYSRTFSARAIELISHNLETACLTDSLDALQNVMLGSYFAGCGINCAGIGIAHIVGQPLGAVLHKAHGDLITVLLPLAMQYNRQDCEALYAQVGRLIDPSLHAKTQSEAADAAIRFVFDLREKLKLPRTLSELDVKELPEREFMLHNIAITTGHIKSNPRPLTDDLLWAYIQEAFI